MTACNERRSLFAPGNAFAGNRQSGGSQWRYLQRMLEHLRNADLAEAASLRINELIAEHAEWFLAESDGDLHEALKRDEVATTIANGRLILASWTEKGARSWRIMAWEWKAEKLLLQASRRMGAERPLLELIPRASASAVAATVKAARQTRCEQLAQLARALIPSAKVEKATLSPGVRRGQPGRYARIILRLRHERIAVTATVAEVARSDADAFLSAALLWFIRTSERTRPPYLQQLWLILESTGVKPVLDRLVLLRESLKNSICIYEIDHSWAQLAGVPTPERRELWKKRLGRFPPVSEPQTSRSALAIAAQVPEAIDVVQARYGETLRYFGLPFARVRRLLDLERVWFGAEGPLRRTLDESSEYEFANLLDSLREYRAAVAADHHHALYRTASESWLEAMLRRDITKLDPGLIIAPLHAQFRTARGGRLGVRPVDLLALRQDGRLVVIELKVAEDRDHVLQGADYWRRVEAHRRRGHLTRARLFGALKIRDQPPLVYLVAPTLRFHPSFQTLARTIAPDIEIYRFDINEDWRAGVRVMRRMRVN